MTWWRRERGGGGRPCGGNITAKKDQVCWKMLCQSVCVSVCVCDIAVCTEK